MVVFNYLAPSNAPMNASPTIQCRRAARALLALVAGSLCAVSCDQMEHQGVPPSVILITLDTVRADCLGSYGAGAGATPALDAFAGVADRYATCVSAAPWTMPTHGSLFTGLYPFEHGSHSYLPKEGVRVDNVSVLDPRMETLAEALGARGYLTGGVVSNAAYLRPGLGLEQGFQTWDVHRTGAAKVNERALDWLDESDASTRPTFLFVNYMDAHRPYATGDRADKPNKHLDGLIEGVMVRGEEPGPLGDQVRALHQKAVTRLDSQLGQFFDELRTRGIFDDSLIIVTSDHGEAFGDHGIVEHSKDVYEELLRVPLLVKFPGQEVGTVLKTRASSVHVPGLVASAMGGTDAETLRDVFPRTPGQDGFGGAVVAENYYSRMKDLERYGTRFRRRRRAVYQGPLKLIVGDDETIELYDVEQDPGELNNLMGTREADGARLAQSMDRVFSAPTAFRWDPILPGQMTAEEFRSMSDMGYSGGADEDSTERPDSDSDSDSGER